MIEFPKTLDFEGMSQLRAWIQQERRENRFPSVTNEKGEMHATHISQRMTINLRVTPHYADDARNNVHVAHVTNEGFAAPKGMDTWRGQGTLMAALYLGFDRPALMAALPEWPPA